MYSRMWAQLKLCQYNFIMVTRRAQDQVKETLKQPYQTTVSIEWLPCFSLMQQVTMKYAKKCNYLRRESRLEFALSFTKRVPLELWCQPKGDLAIQYQKPPMQIQSAMYMYIYTVFAIAVYLGSTYTLIYTWSTNWHNESLCFKMLLGKELCHSCTKTTYQKTIELQKASNQE